MKPETKVSASPGLALNIMNQKASSAQQKRATTKSKRRIKKNETKEKEAA